VARISVCLWALDGRFRRSAVFVAPDKRELSTNLAVFVINDAQREHRAFVEAVGAEGREPDDFAVLHYFVVRERCLLQ
jgi:hypothetical protein